MNTTYNVTAAHARIDADRRAVGMAGVLERPAKYRDWSITKASKWAIGLFLFAQLAYGAMYYFGV